ncbi:Maf-like protein [Corynebacterium humireducens NBRC 106098 = DSM 45392]|uniref:Nucleoside triphosphate pyrophosphatase n=1 Tax=Corynebacterium humireducens NBRC 106098 = DSM 45392 TaxID=1223515 RepID=A0A0B5D0Q1_9CORY|nr:nucleoside triphosphate pyrophosphatase [Corynebacterium humireducens]AJE32370.1 Maf-like protein [Corynebacterium humireducens NBRC 106098 = DSM 45392]
MRIVLASSSPSRRMILANAGVDPVIQPADVDEDALLASLQDASPADAVAALARAKAHAVAGQFHGDVVIGGDSMLLLDGRLQGKPHTEEATVERWREQAGKVAQLLTGHCIVHRGEEFVETTSTTVHFAAASEADIRAYAASGEPWQCAGAFTLEALGGWFIDRIEGDPSSVIGLSLPTVRRALYRFGLDASAFWRS